jgi:hypothetical protein
MTQALYAHMNKKNKLKKQKEKQLQLKEVRLQLLQVSPGSGMTVTFHSKHKTLVGEAPSRHCP